MLAMARAMVARPRLLLLDEISTGLAPSLVGRLLGAVRRAADEGATVVLVEQYVEAALGLADYVYVLESGRVADVAEPSDLQAAGVAGAYLGD